MDIQTIKHLQSQRAAITLVLKAEKIRNTFTEFNLYALFEVSNLTGKKLIPATVLVDSNRYRHSIVQKLADAGLNYVETVLADAASGTSPEFCSPEPAQCQRSCHMCGKTDLDLSAGCFNASVFSPAVGDWVCNVNLELSK
jgi:hypothetical protein